MWLSGPELKPRRMAGRNSGRFSASQSAKGSPLEASATPHFLERKFEATNINLHLSGTTIPDEPFFVLVFQKIIVSFSLRSLRLSGDFLVTRLPTKLLITPLFADEDVMILGHKKQPDTKELLYNSLLS